MAFWCFWWHGHFDKIGTIVVVFVLLLSWLDYPSSSLSVAWFGSVLASHTVHTYTDWTGRLHAALTLHFTMPSLPLPLGGFTTEADWWDNLNWDRLSTSIWARALNYYHHLPPSLLLHWPCCKHCLHCASSGTHVFIVLPRACTHSLPPAYSGMAAARMGVA